MSQLICLGEAMVELNEQENGIYKEGFGGDTSNCAVAAARAGADVGVIGALGDDHFGEKILQLWKKESINFNGIYNDPHHPTGMYLVSHDAEGHHFHYYRKGSAASLYQEDQLPIEIIKKAKILHISGISLAISDEACAGVFAAVKLAKDHNVKISFDTNLRLKLWDLEKAKKVINQMASYADYLLPGFDDAALLTDLDNYEEICTFYHDLGAENIALTDGSKGVYLSTKDGVDWIEARKVKAVDATGAGDTFDGNFLARILDGDHLLEATKYANAAASLAVQGYGAIDPMPTKNQVMEILKS